MGACVNIPGGAVRAIVLASALSFVTNDVEAEVAWLNSKIYPQSAGITLWASASSTYTFNEETVDARIVCIDGLSCPHWGGIYKEEYKRTLTATGFKDEVVARHDKVVGRPPTTIRLTSGAWHDTRLDSRGMTSEAIIEVKFDGDRQDLYWPIAASKLDLHLEVLGERHIVVVHGRFDQKAEYAIPAPEGWVAFGSSNNSLDWPRSDIRSLNRLEQEFAFGGVVGTGIHFVRAGLALRDRKPVKIGYGFNITFAPCSEARYAPTATQKLKSIEQAAQAALAEAWAKTTKTGHEYGGYIYELAKGADYRYAPPVEGTVRQSDGRAIIKGYDMALAYYMNAAPFLCDGSKARIVGHYHTHPEIKEPVRPVFLSFDDLNFGIDNKLTMFLRGQNWYVCGMQVYEASSSGDTFIPKDPDRKKAEQQEWNDARIKHAKWVAAHDGQVTQPCDEWGLAKR
jgi:hypothetical protein